MIKNLELATLLGCDQMIAYSIRQKLAYLG